MSCYFNYCQKFLSISMGNTFRWGCNAKPSHHRRYCGCNLIVISFCLIFIYFLSFCNFILIDLSLIFSTSTTKLDKNTSFCTMKRTHMAHRDTEFENRSLQYGNCIIRDQSNDDTSALSDLIETDDKRASKKNAKQIIWKITKDEKTRRRRNRWF